MKQLIPLLFFLLLIMAGCANPGPANNNLTQDITPHAAIIKV